MIRPKTLIHIKDNTGVKTAQCIQILKDSRKLGAAIGNIIVVSIKNVLSEKKLKKGQVKRAIVIESKKPINRSNFESLKFNYNSAVLINYDNKGEIIPIGTRILTSIPRELKVKKLLKVVSLASSFI